MTEKISIHFQEGFVGETVELWRGADRLGRWPLKTRMQTGLAHIETLDAEPGDEIRVTMPQTGAQVQVSVPGPNEGHVFLINQEGQELRVKTTEDEPGYL